MNIVTEMQSIAKKVVELVNTYPNLPCKCVYQELDASAPYSLSLSSVASAPRLDTDVTGGYTGIFPFAVYMRVYPDDGAERIDCEQFMNELALYIVDNYAAIELDGGRIIEDIEQTQIATLINRMNDDSYDYQTIFSLRYNATTNNGDIT